MNSDIGTSEPMRLFPTAQDKFNGYPLIFCYFLYLMIDLDDISNRILISTLY